MINAIHLLRNIGQFDSVASGVRIPFNRLTLIFAENGRGKTTLGAIFRSLLTNDPILIAERKRLGADHPPHVVIDCSGGPSHAIFQNNAWNRTLHNLMIYDDFFVDSNVYSGLIVRPDHRQNLHELILGSQGVTLNRQLQELIAQIEALNADLRTKAAAIPASDRGQLSVDEFCALPPRADVDEAIKAAERRLTAIGQQDSIRAAPTFKLLALPAFDLPEITSTLQVDLPTLDASAASRVQKHLALIGQDAEPWVAGGMARLTSTDASAQACPFLWPRVRRFGVDPTLSSLF